MDSRVSIVVPGIVVHEVIRVAGRGILVMVRAHALRIFDVHGNDARKDVTLAAIHEDARRISGVPVGGTTGMVTYHVASRRRAAYARRRCHPWPRRRAIVDPGMLSWRDWKRWNRVLMCQLR